MCNYISDFVQLSLKINDRTVTTVLYKHNVYIQIELHSKNTVTKYHNKLAMS